MILYMYTHEPWLGILYRPHFLLHKFCLQEGKSNLVYTPEYMCTQGSPSGCGRREIPGVTQVELQKEQSHLFMSEGRCHHVSWHT